MEIPGEKLVIKLWETLAEKGLGSLLAPGQAIRDSQARNEIRRAELLMLAQAEVDAAEIRAGRKRLERDGTLCQLTDKNSTDSSTSFTSEGQIESKTALQSLAEVSACFNVAQEARSEINASKAIIHAEEILANDSQQPSERSIEEDWLFAWRDYAGRVSTEDLQQLWGKVLAGEIKSPGTYSYRTLEFLKGLSKDEAEEISKLASFVIERNIIRSQKKYLDEQGITFRLLLRMQELGLVSGVEAIGLTTSYNSVNQDRFVLPMRSNGKVLIVEHDDPSKLLTLSVYLVTIIGAQLFSLGSFQPNSEYLRLIGKEIISQGFTVQLADWKQLTETQGNYYNQSKIDA